MFDSVSNICWFYEVVDYLEVWIEVFRFGKIRELMVFFLME